MKRTPAPYTVDYFATKTRERPGRTESILEDAAQASEEWYNLSRALELRGDRGSAHDAREESAQLDEWIELEPYCPGCMRDTGAPAQLCNECEAGQ